MIRAGWSRGSICVTVPNFEVIGQTVLTFTSQKLGSSLKGGAGSLWTQCGLGRGLPLYQVASWSIQSFGHNRHGSRFIWMQAWPVSVNCAVGRGAAVPLSWGKLGPHLTQCAWAKAYFHIKPPQSTPSSILIHPTVWQQYTNVTDRQDRQWS